MPKYPQARAARDEGEERQGRKLAGSHHSPAERDQRETSSVLSPNSLG